MIGTIVAKKNLMRSFQAMNNHDIDEFMSGWRDDGVFIYPGELSVSGTFEGRDAVEKWFRNFFDHYPKIKFDVQDICLKNIFDLTGNNVAAVHWNIELTNRDGREGQNSGVTVITIEGGKAVRAKDFFFDQGQNFKLNWGAA